MESLRELYKVGRGPSSSHTIGPERAIKQMKERFPKAEKFKVTLYGSLAMTGKGHATDEVIFKTAEPVECEVIFDVNTPCDFHPNTMDIEVFEGGKSVACQRVYSVGGGTILFDGEKLEKKADIYPHSTFAEIADYCKQKNIRLWEYVVECEGRDILIYLEKIWDRMKATVHEGLTCSGILPNGLETPRRAQYLYHQRHIDESSLTRANRLVCSYAFATSEQNASGGIVVTAPTCGSCGVLPAVMKYMQETRGFADDDIVRALAVGGLIGNIVKKNASISGAECGCQAEIGTACSMAAGALAELFELGLDQIEYAAEVAMEHHLGLTCDPVGGLVQIPCIERNAVAAMRAINALSLADFLAESSQISFDTVVETMYQTGRDLLNQYRETSSGGLAIHYRKRSV